MPDDFRQAARRICAAMAAAPDMVSAPGAFNSELLNFSDGGVIAKGGAEGLFAAGIADSRGLGLAVKAADGSGRPPPPVVMRILEHYGALTESAIEALGRFRRPSVCNCHGTVVGAIEPIFELT